MIKELRKFNNLGSPDYFFELLNHINNAKKTDWKKKDLSNLFYNKIINGESVFDGCLELVFKINILQLNDKFICINPSFISSLDDINKMINSFNTLLFEKLKDDLDFLSIFSSKHLSYDVIYKSLIISNSAFGLKFANFKHLLLNFNILKEHPTKAFNSFIINTKHKKTFDQALLPEIKKRKLGIEEFKKRKEIQQLHGDEAEKFVLQFEYLRLNKKKKIDWVAEYIVNEGYDIASYNSETDIELNRFIEVKSYSGDTPYFFWSRNEYFTAKRKQNEYWIYLVNRDEMNKEDYEPRMEQNPIKNVFKNEKWDKQIENYKLTLKK